MNTSNSFGGKILLGVAALAVFGGTFALASGSIIEGGNSFLAAAIASISGSPTVIIGRDAGSPSGTIYSGYTSELARFDVTAKNITHWASVNSVYGKATITLKAPSPMYLANVSAQYYYCIPPDKTYGYGWKGGGCASTPLSAYVDRDSSGNYTLSFALPHIYPQASPSYISIYGLPQYQYTGSYSANGAGNAKVQVSITSASATGDKCQTITYGLQGASYSYQGKCVASGATVNITSPGNTLTIQRQYGYGYYPSPGPIITAVNGPLNLQTGQIGSWTVVSTMKNEANVQLSYGVWWGDEVNATTPGTAARTPSTNVKPPLQVSATFSHAYQKPGTYYPQFWVSNGRGWAYKSVTVVVGSGGTVTLSVGSSPSSQTITAGGVSVPVASIILDAIKSTENLSFSGAIFSYTDNIAADPTSCGVYDGSTLLNSGANIVNPNGSNYYKFYFNSSITVAKGATKTLTIKCNISSSATSGSSFSWGLQNDPVIAAKGVTSGQAVTPTVLANPGPTMTIGGVNVTVGTDAASPGYGLVPAGALNVLGGIYKFHADVEPAVLSKIDFRLTQGSSSDLVKGSLYDGSTKIGEVYFAGNNNAATAVLTKPVTIPKDGDKSLTLKLDLSPIGVSQSVTHSGDLVAVDIFGGSGSGANSGMTFTVNGSSNVTGVRIMKSYPTVAKIALPATGVADGRLLRFSVTANAAGPVSVGRLVFSIGSAGARVSSTTVYAYTDSGFSQPVSESVNGQVASVNGTADFYKPVQIPAGQSRYFEVRSQVSPISSPSSYGVNITMWGDERYWGFFTLNQPTGDFIWSPNSLGTPGKADSDWTNAYGVPGLPSSGISQERSQ
jgi:hypothetical protein